MKDMSRVALEQNLSATGFKNTVKILNTIENKNWTHILENLKKERHTTLSYIFIHTLTDIKIFDTYLPTTISYR